MRGLGVVLALICAVVLPAGLFVPEAVAAGTTNETTGGVTHTWTDYSDAGGSEGPSIPGNDTVAITCVVKGFTVADGNDWWYEIASSPWDNTYYASADAFYNNGSTSGSLRGTPFVDPAVPVCGSGSQQSAPSPTVTLAQGPPAPQGYRYAISLANFAPSTSVSISCRDSVDPGGFYSFSLTTDASGSASTHSYCYSADGPDHWVVAAGVTSNRVTWQGGGGSGGSQGATAPAGGSSGSGRSSGSTSGGAASSPPASGSTAPDSCAGPADSGSYDGWAACEWAVHNWDTPPRFANDDCAWFASQALWQGDLPKSASWTSASWNPADLAIKNPGSSDGPFAFPGPTVDAASAPELVDYLLNAGLATEQTIRWSDNTADGARIGDLIAYSWNNPPDGHIDHVAIVTGFSGSYPLVSQHTEARLNRGWSWDPNAKNWIQYSHPGSVAFLIHITA